MAAFFLHVGEDVFERGGFVGEDYGAAEQLEFGRVGAGEEEILEVNDGGGDIVAIDEWVAAEAVAAGDEEVVVEAVGCVHAAHLGAGAHGVADREFSEIEDVFEKQQPAKAHEPRRLGLIEQDAKFVFAVGVVAAGFAESNELEQEVCGPIEDEQGECEECVKNPQHGSCGESGPVGASNGHGFGDEFTDEDVGVADDGVADGKGHGVSGEKRGGGFGGEQSGPEQEWFHEADDGRFTDEAESDGSESDADLANGEVFVEVILDVFSGSGAADAAVGEFTDARGPHFDGRKFGENKESVEKDEEYGKEQVQQGHSLILKNVGIRSCMIKKNGENASRFDRVCRGFEVGVFGLLRCLPSCADPENASNTKSEGGRQVLELGRTLFAGPDATEGAAAISASELWLRTERAALGAGASGIQELAVIVDPAAGWEELLPLAIRAAQWLGARLMVCVEPSAAGAGRMEEVQQELMQCDYRTLPLGMRCVEMPGAFEISALPSEAEDGMRLVLHRRPVSVFPEAT
jgi:hypothetical protein